MLTHKEQGDKAEADFLKIMRAHGFIVKKATQKQDYFEHTDFFVDGDRVDVKSCKKIYGKYQDEYTWVEIQNMGYPGWLYARKVNYFAFQLYDGSFLVIKKAELQEIAEKHLQKCIKCTKNIEDVKKGSAYFGRVDKNEKVILVPTKLIRSKGVIYPKQD